MVAERLEHAEADVELDAAVRGPVREQAVDEVGGAPSGVRQHTLDHRAADESAHGVRHQVHAWRAGLETDLVHEAEQVLRSCLQPVGHRRGPVGTALLGLRPLRVRHARRVPAPPGAG
jgi:hypothetical protein